MGHDAIFGEHCSLLTADPSGGHDPYITNYGIDGVQAGRWDWFYCEYRQYHPSNPGLYFLWSFTY
ncbi:hypothetical protein [Phytohabitans kaempferiae]|uniref:Uncharacterized protein n=1 Tax=Phytohabitans kaempferiae TaxID=1620943 RepID=A0ABV6M9R7_9ACTN